MTDPSGTHGLTGWLTERDVAAFHALLESPISAPSKPALTALIRRLLARVPFQNLCMLAGPRRAPTRAEIRDDMLSGRGGPCGHMNPFFAALLHELGYRVALVAGTMQQPDCHIAMLVTLGGERLWVDVGNAFPYLEPIALGDPQPRRHPLLDHRLCALDGARWRIEHRRPGSPTWTRNYEFSVAPRTIESFETMIESHYRQPSYGPFLRGLRAVRFPSADAAVVVRDRTVRVIDDRKDHTQTYEKPELCEALRAHFAGIDLPIEQAIAQLERPL